MSFKFECNDIDPKSLPAFFLVKIHSDVEKLNLEEIEIQIIITQSLNNLFGEIGMVGLVPRIIKYDKEKRIIILETNQKSVTGLTQALSLTNGISNTNPYKLAFKILNVTNFLGNIDVNSQNDFFR
ncbi:unnamed protein product [Brachionus calyciflorus]|uniref:Uncharacterized protein n=1 Tax=Brachionus calyciflorus TaxID=104777 RepID=A0A813MAK9_9BILA|nr:unnamed protein product [Brachionus calyciflorus]